MVGNAIVKRDEEAKEVEWHKISKDDYTQVGKVVNGRHLLSRTGLRSLFKLHPFTEIRFYCHKKYHGRKLHLKTVGSDVVDWLIHRRGFPPISCGSYHRLPTDTSIIGEDCHRWWENRWCNSNIYQIPIGADDGSGSYLISLDSLGLSCDDYWTSYHPGINVGEWRWYVR